MNSFTFGEREISLFYRIFFFTYHSAQAYATQTGLVIYISQYFRPGFSFLPQSFSWTALAWLLPSLHLIAEWLCFHSAQIKGFTAVVTCMGLGFIPFLRPDLRRWWHADSSMNNLSELLDSIKNRLLCSLLLTPSFLNSTEMWEKNNVIIRVMCWDHGVRHYNREGNKV